MYKRQICQTEIIDTLPKAEPIGPKKRLDAIIVAPCTGNTLAKLANSITDTTATLAVKAHLRNQRPVILALASNDALAGNAKNLGILPVSYTHLDVYKRQLQSVLMAGYRQ